MKKISILLFLLTFIADVFLLTGCILFSPISSSFDNDEYVWENWHNSTNVIHIEQINLSEENK